ncbi:MAG: helix-turn-helix domain-containing protein [Nocardioides sp.]
MTASDRAVRRTRLSPAQRRRQLLDAGMELAAEHSLELVTIEAVAERVGVSRALVFHYFASKQEFHLALVQEQAEQMLERTMPPDDADNPIEMLSAAMGAYLDYVAENEEHYLGVLRGTLSADPAMRKVADSTREEMTQRILAHAPALGIVPTPAVTLAVQSWTAFVEDVMVRWITQKHLTREQVHGILVGSLPALAGAASLVD